jgi:hypothetical protein
VLHLRILLRIRMGAGLIRLNAAEEYSTTRPDYSRLRP